MPLSAQASSYLPAFSIFFMALWKSLISWLKKKKTKIFLPSYKIS